MKKINVSMIASATPPISDKILITSIFNEYNKRYKNTMKLILLNYDNGRDSISRYLNKKNILELKPKVNFPIFSDVLKNIQIYFLFKESIKKRKIKSDIITFYMPSRIYLASLISRPKVCIITDILPLRPKEDVSFFEKIYWKTMERYKYNIDHFITISKSSKNILHQYWGIPLSKISVIYPGINHEIFKPLNHIQCKRKLGLKNKKVILHVGSEEKRKNVSFLIRLVAELKKDIKDIVLIRVGTPKLENEKLIKRLNLESNIIYYKDIPTKQLVEIYNAADIVIFPSKYEGFGLPVLEAMSCGIPVLITNSTSLPEIVGKAAPIIEINDLNNAYNVVKKILTNEKEWKKLSEKCLKRSYHFNWQKSIEKLFKIYKKVYLKISNRK
jgi:glycosyltransferase involved in cell wall biosynthesis